MRQRTMDGVDCCSDAKYQDNWHLIKMVTEEHTQTGKTSVDNNVLVKLLISNFSSGLSSCCR